MNARQRRKQKRRQAAEKRLLGGPDAFRDPLEDALTVWITEIKLEEIKYSETPSGA